MDLRNVPLSDLLADRRIFEIFDEEFSKNKWLNLSALQESDSSIADLYADGTVPATVLDNIASRLDTIYGRF